MSWILQNEDSQNYDTDVNTWSLDMFINLKQKYKRIWNCDLRILNFYGLKPIYHFLTVKYNLLNLSYVSKKHTISKIHK